MTKAHIIHSNTDLILNVLINLKLNAIKDRQYKKEERSQNIQSPAVTVFVLNIFFLSLTN